MDKEKCQGMDQNQQIIPCNFIHQSSFWWSIYGILGVEGSVTSSIVKHYITELVSRRKCGPEIYSKPFYVWNNLKVHSNKPNSNFL